MKNKNGGFISKLSLDDFIKKHFSEDEIEDVKNTVSYKILKEVEGDGENEV